MNSLPSAIAMPKLVIPPFSLEVDTSKGGLRRVVKRLLGKKCEFWPPLTVDHISDQDVQVSSLVPFHIFNGPDFCSPNENSINMTRVQVLAARHNLTMPTMVELLRLFEMEIDINDKAGTGFERPRFLGSVADEEFAMCNNVVLSLVPRIKIDRHESAKGMISEKTYIVFVKR